MTMIAFATYGDHAEFITDSASYTANGATLSKCSKALTLPHLDTAVLTQGDGLFGTAAQLAAMQASGHLPTLDALVEELPQHLRAIWAERQRESNGAVEAIVFLIGYSTSLERFAAWSFASDRDSFTPARMDAPYVMPCPWSMRPDMLQAKRYRAWDRDAAAFHGTKPVGHQVLATWLQRPPMPAPGSVDQWRELAQLVREERAATDYASVYVAGDVFHTRIGRGEVATRRIHTYDDTGDQFLRMISGTQHPIAQLMPCPCGADATYLECCLAPALDERCGCNAPGKTFRECCAVGALRSLRPDVSGR